MTNDPQLKERYIKLEGVLRAAYEQAALGKGDARHANGLPFHDQRILVNARSLNSPVGLAQQVLKKTQEALGLSTKQAQVNELLGAIIYLAAMVIFIEEED